MSSWTDRDHEDIRQDRAAIAREAGLEEPPPGRLWLLRSPWPSVSLSVVLAVIGEQARRNTEDYDVTAFTSAAREVLLWSQDDLWQRLGPHHPATSWRDRGRVGEAAADVVLAGLTPSDVERLAEHGLTERQAIAWCEAVGGPREDAVERVLGWLALGLPPEAEWPSMLLDEHPDAVAVWLQAGLSLEQTEALYRHDLAAVLHWLGAGFDHARIGQLLDADPTLTPPEARAFEAAGFDDAARLAWVELGFTAAQAQTWSAAGVLRNEARVWRAEGFTPQDAAAAASTAGPTDPEEPVLPPGWEGGWFAPGRSLGRAHRAYGVTDPPGTRGSRCTT